MHSFCFNSHLIIKFFSLDINTLEERKNTMKISHFFCFVWVTLFAICPVPGASALYEWEPIGASGGDQYQIKILPSDPNTLFSFSFGVHRSKDGGLTWESLHTSDMGTVQNLGLAFDPLNDSHMFLSSSGKGVWETHDQGDSWEQNSSGLPTLSGNPNWYHAVIDVAYDENGNLFAGIGLFGDQEEEAPPHYIYRYNTELQKWTPSDTGIPFPVPEVTNNDITLTQNVNILLTNDAENHLWAVIYGSGVYFFDNGEWISRNGDLPPEALRCTSLQIDPSDSAHMLLGTEYNWVYETEDGGLSWIQIPLPESLAELDVLPLVYTMAIDPNNSQFIHVQALDSHLSTEHFFFHANPDQSNGGGYFVSTNSGMDWEELPLMIYQITVDSTETVTTGTFTRSKNWYLTSGGFMSVRTSSDGFSTFDISIQGINGLTINSLFLHPNPPTSNDHDMMLFSGAEAGISQYRGVPGNWESRDPADEYLYTWSFASDPTDTNRLYYSTGNPAWSYGQSRGVYRVSLDCFTWSCSPREQLLSNVGVWRVITSNALPDALYAACQEEGILVSYDQGSNWTPLNQGLTLPMSITDIVLDADGQPLYASARTNNGMLSYETMQFWHLTREEKGGVYRFDSDTDQWVEISGLTAAVMDLEIDPQDPRILYAATAVGIYKYMAGEETWEAISENLTLPVYDLLIHPTQPDYFYFATSGTAGVYRSTTRGEQWHEYAAGLLFNQVTSLEINPDTGILYAGTAGNSVFQVVPDQAPEPAIRLDPETLDCESAPVGLSSYCSVRIWNDGEADLIIDTIEPESAAFTPVDFTQPITITPGSYKVLPIEFRPQSLGPVTGVMTFWSNDPNASSVDLSITGEGREAFVPVPEVKINGVDQHMDLSYGSEFVVTVDLIGNDYAGQILDFWLGISIGDNQHFWFVKDIGFVESTDPVLMMSNGIPEVMETITLNIPANISGPGEVFFAVDENADGIFDGTWTNTVAFMVEKAPAVIYLSPLALDFGKVYLGSDKTFPLHITNSGEQDLIVNSVENLDGAFTFTELPAFPITIRQGEINTFMVRFSPQSEGVTENQLIFHSNDPETPAYGVVISGEGLQPVEPVPDVKVNDKDGPLELAYGEPVDISFAFARMGSNDSQLSDVWIRLTFPDHTTYWMVAGQGWVKSPEPQLFFSLLLRDFPLPFPLAFPSLPSGNYDIFFALDDNADGLFNGTWSDSVQFTVKQAPPALLLSSDTINMGEVPVGAEKISILRLANSGGQDLVVSHLETEGNYFEMVNPSVCPLALASGEWIDIQLRYAPMAEGSHAGTLAIESNDTLQSLHTVDLQGLCTAAVPPAPSIKANGQSSHLSVSLGTTVDVSIELQAEDYLAREMEWWIEADTPYGSIWLTPDGWQFSDSPIRFKKAPIGNISPLTIFSVPIWAGESTFRFTIDDKLNNTYDPVWVDTVAVSGQ